MVDDRRKALRYPCILHSKLFSPRLGGKMDTLGEHYLEAVCNDISLCGMSFDVTEYIKPEQQLYIIIPDDEQGDEKLQATVCWCRLIEEGHYRVGLSLDQAHGVEKLSATENFSSVTREPAVPMEAEMTCPACRENAIFIYKGIQTHGGTEGILPLYNCTACGTTRTIPSLLRFNRDLIRK